MFDGKTILITGGTGSWGNELVKQLFASWNPKEIRIYSRGEPKQVRMKQQYADAVKARKIKFIIGDVRDAQRLHEATRGADILFHLAALKHVPVCEENPEEAVKTNIQGTLNAVRAAKENELEFMALISTDKAVDPFNLYGTTKAVAEKVVIAANLDSQKTRFCCIRGGNVIGTSGSFVPIFKEQILKANKITITDPHMTRYFFPLEDAISLIFRAAEKAVGGEVFVMKMPATTVKDVVDVMIEHLGNKETERITIGIRPGEKIHEVLVSRYEAPRAIDDGKYYIILPMIPIPAIARTYTAPGAGLAQEFSSENAHRLTREELTAMLTEEGWLDKSSVPELEDLTPKQVLNYAKAQGWETPGKK